jgi:hypothetical protein
MVLCECCEKNEATIVLKVCDVCHNELIAAGMEDSRG